LRNWWQLIQERFSPALYLPLILVFTWTNGIYLAKSENMTWDYPRFAIVLVMILSFFFRMRLFDEIKDYDVDLKINPTRPLARGIIKIPQVKTVLACLILLELIIASSLGLWPFLVHALAIGYSLLMYEEFFIGDNLRPHLTTYAVTHTFVSVLLGLSAAVSLTGFSLEDMHIYHIAFFLMNWAFFNLFEFARKTFAAAEERPGVPSYSNIFGSRRAYLLSISEAFIGVLLVHAALKNPLMVSYQSIFFLLLFFFYFYFTVRYLFKPSPQAARIFRAATGAYLLSHYILVSFILGV
jgi:4-hydroxybenzoate polyprenyltransferase